MSEGLAQSVSRGGPSSSWRYSAWWLAGGVALLAVGALVVELTVAPGVEARAEEAWRGRLAAMALDRARLVDGWLEEHLAEAALVGRYPTVHWLFDGRRFGSPPFPPELGAVGHLRELLTASIQVHHLLSAWVIGADGSAVASAGASGEALARLAAERALETGPFADFAGTASEGPLVAFASPLPSRLATVVLLAAPQEWLDPLLLAEPPSPTVECLLVRARGERVEFLTPLRDGAAAGESLARPLATPELAATAALSGQRGFGEFRDYRDARVYASIRQLRSADWGLVVKVDRDDALQAARREIREQTLLVEMGLTVLLLLAYAAARRQRSRHALTLARREAELARLLEHGNDAILLVDRRGRIRATYGAAETLYGRRSEDLVGTGLEQLLPERARGGEGLEEVEAAFRSGQLTFETEHVSAEEESIPVEVSARTVTRAGEELLLAIVRDVRGQRAEESRGRALDGLLRTMAEVDGLVQDERDPERLFSAICDFAVRNGAFATAWIGLLEGEGRLALRSAAGVGAGALPDLTQRLGQQTLWWRAVREDRVCTWTRGTTGPDPECAGWMRREGLAVAVAAPLRHDGRPTGVIALYARDSALGDELSSLVGELAVDVSLALDAAEAHRHRDAAREELRVTEERFRQFAESARDMVYRYRVDPPAVEYVSPSVTALTGYAPEDFYADPNLMLRCVHAEDRERVERPLAGEGSFDEPIVVRLVHRDGRTVWSEHRVVPTREAGRVVLDGIARDVTERVVAEEELRRARERYRVALLHSPVVVFEQDRELRYTWVHDPERRLVGDGVGLTDAELLPEEDASRLSSLKRRVLETGEGVRELFESRDGHAFDLVLEPLRARGQSVVGVIGTAIDVTALRERDARLRQLSRAIEQSPSSVVITDTEGTIEYVNSTFSSVTGYSPEEVLGRPARILKSGEHPRELYTELWRTITAGREWRGELCNRRKDGTLYWESVSIAPLEDDAGRVTHFVSVQSDLTERRAAERELGEARQQLVQSQKLEAVGRLAGGVAHDFNNLLNVIMGFTELLARGLGEDARAQKRIEQIMGAARRAGGLTRQLLAFSRRQVLQPRVVDLDEIVQEFEKMLRRLIGEDVVLTVRGSAEPTQVLVDPGQMEQVLMNLCVNARDAMPRGGQLRIGTSVVRLDQGYAASHGRVEPGTYVLLAVSDTGTGMDAETQAHIFEPFFTTKESGIGTGLGLATVYGIVKQSGGYVWVYSEPGVGTTFKIYLPLAAEEPGLLGPEPLAPPARATQSDVSVLLVEDQDALREMIEEVLGGLGYRVETAADGENALEVATSREQPVDLLLTDLVMPGMSGRELAERLRDRWPGLRVLYMSGYTADVVARHGILEPGVQLLHKPFATAELARRLREALEAEPRL